MFSHIFKGVFLTPFGSHPPNFSVIITCNYPNLLPPHGKMMINQWVYVAMLYSRMPHFQRDLHKWTKTQHPTGRWQLAPGLKKQVQLSNCKDSRHNGLIFAPWGTSARSSLSMRHSCTRTLCQHASHDTQVDFAVSTCVRTQSLHLHVRVHYLRIWFRMVVCARQTA